MDEGSQIRWSSGTRFHSMAKVRVANPLASPEPTWTSPSSSEEHDKLGDQTYAWSWHDDPLMRELNSMTPEAELSPSKNTESRNQRKHSMTGATSPLQSFSHEAKPQSVQQSHGVDDLDSSKVPLLLQPEIRQIKEDQLVNEVKAIYAGLVVVEKRCVEIDRQQSITCNKMSDDQWQALIALHRTLLYEHHDFFLASQHPSASPALRRLAAKYAMPARMWKHGMHAFLELMRHQLPDTYEYMLSFTDLAGCMANVMEEILPGGHYQWEECRRCLKEYSKMLEQIPIQTPGSINDDEEEDLQDNHFQSYPPPNPPNTAGNEQNYIEPPFKLTRAVICLLSGWLEYGQGIAADFQIYCKVFQLLLASGMW